LSEQREYV